MCPDEREHFGVAGMSLPAGSPTAS